MRQNAQKKYFCVSGHLGNLKTYLDVKFQLIWPSNEARASKQAFFFSKVIFFWPKSGHFGFSRLIEGQMSWNLVSDRKSVV